MIEEIWNEWKIQNNILGIVISQFQHLYLEEEKTNQYYKVCLIEELRYKLILSDSMIKYFQGKNWTFGINTSWKET